jgi:hypothetical protein
MHLYARSKVGRRTAHRVSRAWRVIKRLQRLVAAIAKSRHAPGHTETQQSWQAHSTGTQSEQSLASRQTSPTADCCHCKVRHALEHMKQSWQAHKTVSDKNNADREWPWLYHKQQASA